MINECGMTVDKSKMVTRCPWVNLTKPYYVLYHDIEWGVPRFEDRYLFEMLILEGAQAGLNWEAILKRREDYREAFKGFDPVLVAQMSDTELIQLYHGANIIRNWRKIQSVRLNAQVFLCIQDEYGGFSQYLWAFVNHAPITNRPKTMADVPTKTELSDKISKDLKRRGMKFIGPTIIYAYMQAIGMVNDHLQNCFKHASIKKT